jgi:predicted nucleic acid-binding protein
VQLIRIDDALIERAIGLPPSTRRSLDALHLATALTLGGDLGAVVTYDGRMIAGATAIGLPVSSPS